MILILNHSNNLKSSKNKLKKLKHQSLPIRKKFKKNHKLKIILTVQMKKNKVEKF
jgi:hypothetical protein